MNVAKSIASALAAGLLDLLRIDAVQDLHAGAARDQVVDVEHVTRLQFASIGERADLLTERRVRPVVAGHEWRQLIGANQPRIHALEPHLVIQTPAREFDLRRERTVSGAPPEADLPPLRGVGLFRLGDTVERDASGAEHLRERGRSQEQPDLVLQGVTTDAGDIQIEIFGQPDAAMEEPEVAAALDDVERLVEPAAQLREEQQVKLLDDLDGAEGVHATNDNTNKRHYCQLVVLFN